MGHKIEIKNKIENIEKYLDYLKEHITNIEISLEHILDILYDVNGFDRKQLVEDVMKHDLSKVSPNEFIQYVEYFNGKNDANKDDHGRIDKAFEEAWQHHLNKNTHHYESLREDEELRKVDIVHMIIDWYAMALKFGDTPESYYENNKDKIDKYLTEKDKFFLSLIFDKLR